MKEESEKVGLKLNIQKTKIMASGPITSWQIDGETVETVSDFIFWGSKITADGDCRHEIKRRLLLRRKVMTNLDSIFRGGNGTPLQYFCLENPIDRGAWWAAVHGVARVGHDWETSLSLFTFMHWRRKWQRTPVFLPGESQGWGSLVGCRLWGRTESDTTEVT